MNDSDQATPLYDNLRKLISIVDELRDVGLQQFIKLPRIAVVGSQSSGKSSLLEMIVGIDFLPRGAGVVTRRPLELRLVHSPHLSVPYAVFEVNKNEKFTDFDKVRHRIEQLTDEIAGTNKNIKDKEIVMTLYSANAPDLTIIDLPGLTRVPVGDQDENIEEITRSMIERYIIDERTIILCVIPANQDVSTSDSLQLAKRIDPNGDRTLGVFTKIDIMDKGTDARERLLGKAIPLKLGYVGVKGRSQQDITRNVRVKQALATELAYFQQHYPDLPPGVCGTDSLVSKLTKILFQHIREFLPQIHKEIVQKSKECQDRLKDLGEAPPSDTTSKARMLWDKTAQFTELFKNLGLYKDWLKQRPTARYEEKDIQHVIDLHQGDSIPGFPSMDSFLALIHPLLKELKQPAVDLVDEVASQMDLMATDIIHRTFERFPGLVGEMMDCSSKLIREEKENTQQIIERIIEAEQSYIFTNDMDYLTKRTSIIPAAQPSGNNPHQQQMDPQKLFVKEMRDRLDSYFGITLRNIRDTIPRVIGFFLVKAVQDKLQFALHTEVNRNETVMGLLDESPLIAAEREALIKVLDVLQKSKKVLTQDNELAPLNNPRESSSMDRKRVERREDNESKNIPVQNKNENGGKNSGGLFGNYIPKSSK